MEEKYLDLEEKVAIERDYYSGELILERNRSDTELKAAQKAAQDKLIFARTENVKLKEEIKGLKAAKKA